MAGIDRRRSLLDHLRDPGAGRARHSQAALTPTLIGSSVPTSLDGGLWNHHTSCVRFPRMIRITTFAGKRVAVFGLGASGIATAMALVAGGADVVCSDDGAAGVKGAAEAGL